MRKPTEKELDEFLDYRSKHVSLVQKLGKIAFDIDLSNQSETKISNYFTDTVKNLTEVEFYTIAYYLPPLTSLICLLTFFFLFFPNFLDRLKLLS